jgi:tetratricopeptide (TPR) repeat protein
MRAKVVAFVISTLTVAVFVHAADDVKSKPAADANSTDAKLIAPPDVPAAVRQAMQDRDYPAAIKAIDEAARDPKAARDYLAFLKGRALYLAEKYDEAIQRFDTLEKEFPKSPWSRRARFGMALSLAKKGDFRAAELIYRNEAEFLLSADRKQEIADLYLEFAQLYFKPPKEDQNPDFQKALEFFQKALSVGPKPEKKIEVELLVA